MCNFSTVQIIKHVTGWRWCPSSADVFLLLFIPQQKFIWHYLFVIWLLLIHVFVNHQLNDSLLYSKVVCEYGFELHRVCNALEIPLGPQQNTPTLLLQKTHKYKHIHFIMYYINKQTNNNKMYSAHSPLIGSSYLLEKKFPLWSTNSKSRAQETISLLTDALKMTQKY